MDKSLKEELESNFKDIQVNIPEDNRLIISIKKEQVLNILSFLKEKGFRCLSAISCVDWIKIGKFELIYHISSFENGLHLMLKTKIEREAARFITVIPVFKNAQTYEREIWEMFGIEFEGNSRLIPLFLDRWRESPPFRKDFDAREYVERTFGMTSRNQDKEEKG